jgi:hypothetical protein
MILSYPESGFLSADAAIRPAAKFHGAKAAYNKSSKEDSFHFTRGALCMPDPLPSFVHSARKKHRPMSQTPTLGNSE